MRQNLLLAAAVLALAACNNDDAATPSDGEAALQVNAAISGTATRASGTSWAQGDRIGISTSGDTKTDYANMPYRYAGAGFEADGDKIYFQSDDETVTFNAYYPFGGAAGTPAGIVEAATRTDMQAVDKQPAIDFLYAKGATADKDHPSADFTGDAAFHHRMSQLTLAFEEGDDMTFAGHLTAYSLDGLVLEGGFDTATGTAQAKAGGGPETLVIRLPADLAATGKKYTAAPIILFPQDIADGKIVLEVTADGEPYHATLTLPDADGDGTKDTALKPGYNYLFPVTVSKTGLTVGKADIKDWETVTGDESTATM